MKTALLLIDIQSGLEELDFYGGERNNPDAELNCRKLLDLFRDNHWPRYHVQHCSINPSSPLHPSKSGHMIKSIVAPMEGEIVFKKEVNSCFIGTDLEERLMVDGITDVIIAGLTTEHCISSSARMAANLGFSTMVVSDATAAFKKVGPDGKTYDAETIHQTALACLQDEFAEIQKTEDVVNKLF